MYYILADQKSGELLQISSEYITQGEGQIVKVREGDIPDLSKFEWSASALIFVEKSGRCTTQEMSARRFTMEELRTIYSAAKINIDVEIWLDRFKMSKEINLDDEFMLKGLCDMEQAGLLSPGRALELLA